MVNCCPFGTEPEGLISDTLAASHGLYTSWGSSQLRAGIYVIHE